MAMPGARRHYQPWTPEEDQRLRELTRQGYTRRQVARIMHRTVESVKTRAYALRLFTRPIRRAVLCRPDERGRNLRANTIQGYSPVAVRGLIELKAGLAWIAAHTQHGYVVHDGRVRTIGQAVANLIYDLHMDARRARVGEVA